MICGKQAKYLSTTYKLLKKHCLPISAQNVSTLIGRPRLYIANTARCYRQSDFKDGGLQPGSTYISAPGQDSDAVPTANPHFRGPGIQ